MCKEIFGTQEIFRAHIGDFHTNELIPSQIEEFIGASKRFVSRDSRGENCPFCLTATSQTKRLFASHVGRHLQEISLAALPLLDDFSDGEDDSESNDDDDGNDNESSGDEDGNDSENNDDDDDGNDSDDEHDRDKEKDVPNALLHTGEMPNQLNSGRDSSSVKINDSKEIPSDVGVTERDGAPQNTESELGLPISKLEESLAEHHEALKSLWSKLQQWTKCQATADQVSEAYAKVEVGFNIVCQNFTAVKIDVDDFGYVPELL